MTDAPDTTPQDDPTDLDLDAESTEPVRPEGDGTDRPDVTSQDPEVP